MSNFLVWDISTKTDGVWKNINATDAKAAAETICGQKLRTFGKDEEICARVRALDGNEPAMTFYGEKAGAAAREAQRYQELREIREKQLQAAE